MTTYLVHRRVEEQNASSGMTLFERKGEIEAHGSVAALRKAGERWGAGMYAVVPKSNWTEEKVGVETTTRVTVGGATSGSEPQA